MRTNPGYFRETPGISGTIQAVLRTILGCFRKNPGGFLEQLKTVFKADPGRFRTNIAILRQSSVF